MLNNSLHNSKWKWWLDLYIICLQNFVVDFICVMSAVFIVFLLEEVASWRHRVNNYMTNYAPTSFLYFFKKKKKDNTRSDEQYQ